jgi:hypothetical protein
MRAAQARPHDDWLTEEDWLACYEDWGRQGHFQGEPDFPSALAAYRQALEQARAGTDPPFDPPDDFMPGLDDLPQLRLLNWRDKYRFPAVHAAWEWLAEMLHRITEGTPPVTEAEFHELAEWFRANDARLYTLSAPSHLLDLGGGRTTDATNVRYQLSKGPRVLRAGEVAEDVRRLRARYGAGAP